MDTMRKKNELTTDFGDDFWVQAGGLWVIPYVIRKFFSAVEDKGDLVCPAYIALKRARELYNPRLGAFSSYAIKCVRLYLVSYVGKRGPHPSAECEILSSDDDADQRIDINSLMDGACLSALERDYVCMRFFDDMTLQQIATERSVSREFARKLINGALVKLREFMGISQKMSKN